MLLIILVAGQMLFPAGAVWAQQKGGVRGLSLFTGSVVIALVLLALIAASEQGGNRLVRSDGYGHTAIGILLMVGLAFILPVLASATSVWASAPRVRPSVVYLIALAIILIGSGVGIVLSVYALAAWASS